MKLRKKAQLLILAGLALLSAALLAIGILASQSDWARWWSPNWTEDEQVMLQSLWLGSLKELPPDPSNQYGDTALAAQLGQKLFFDTRFSANGEVACATCHQPDRYFTDGLPVGQGVGSTSRNTPTVVGAAFSPWFFRDGRADSEWSQALGPMESAVEHGGTRTQYAHLIYQYYRVDYQAIFGPLPDLSDSTRFPASAGPLGDAAQQAAWESMDPADQQAVTQIFVNMGKALAAYERPILPAPSRFDAYVQALLQGQTVARLQALSPDEVAGLAIFIGKGRCTNCHNGPLLTNNAFHNLGVPDLQGADPDLGRQTGVTQLLASPFNCLGSYSDAGLEDCAELRFIKTTGHEIVRAFRTPSLRNVSQTGPYMHAGQFTTLHEVLDFYNRAPQPSEGHSELVPLLLTDQELSQLEAFLLALDGGINASPQQLAAPEN
jgi:cytochrome c peroxidase